MSMTKINICDSSLFSTFLKDIYVELKKNDEDDLIQPDNFDNTINELYNFINTNKTKLVKHDKVAEL